MTLVERVRQTQFLENSLRGSISGGGCVTLLTGAQGSGKTALLHEFTELALTAGATPLNANCSQIEQSLPFGVVHQLFYELEEHSRAADWRALLDASAATPTPEEMGLLMHRLCLALLQVARDRALVICVDDVEYADTTSLRWLSYLVRRLRRSKIMLVLTQVAIVRPAHRELYAELMRHPYFQQLDLPPLSVEGVAEMLAEHLDRARAQRLAPAAHSSTGGSPLLLEALIEDDLGGDQATEPAGDLVVGSAFRNAVVNCVHRQTPATVAVARAIAVLDESAAPEPLTRLTGMHRDQVGEAQQALHATGLLDGGRFRHPAAQAAVLMEVDAETRSQMYHEAARILHEEGAPAAAVASRLLAAGRDAAVWAIPVLLEAATQAAKHGAAEQASAHLRLALQASTDETQRAKIKALLAAAEWRVNPAAARRHLPDLVAAVREDRLPQSEAHAAVGYLLWHGRVAEARAALDRLRPQNGQPDPETEVNTLLMRLAYPAAAGESQPVPATAARPAGDGTDATLQAATIVAAMTRSGPDEATAAQVEHVLQRASLSDLGVAPLVPALLALLCADHARHVAAWSAALLDMSPPAGSPINAAITDAIRAELAYRRGDLRHSAEHARSAIDHITADGWGIGIGYPLSTLIRASTAMGRHDDAAEQLNTLTPKVMIETPFGLHYLRARGYHRLATNRVLPALKDFQRCGELMRRWQIDVPELIPWRSDAAQAALLLGRRAEARGLVEVQLARLRVSSSRARGLSLRILATTVDLRQRPPFLRQAVAMLRESGDRLELAYAIAEMAEVYRQLGNTSHAGIITRRARRIAEECGADPLFQRLRSESHTKTSSTVEYIGTQPAGNELSDAERRVATLAAQGYTNRQIASTLFITVSTVEQHLTRVYRKLKVNRRADLVHELGMEVVSA